jgi:hypothetical protein
MCIYIKDQELGLEQEKKFGGRWLVESITHNIGGFPLAASMAVVGIRDTQVKDPNETGESPE